MARRPIGGRLYWTIIGCLGAVSGMGCLSFNLGNSYEKASPTSYVDATGLLRQHDETAIAKTSYDSLTIYYPRPYASKPHLKFKKNSDSVSPREIEILEQHPDRFTIRYLGSSSDPVLAWQAEGVPSAATTVVVPTPESKVTPVNGER